MVKSIFFTFCVAFALTSCNKEDPVIIPPILQPELENTLDLSALEAGQRAYFVHYQSSCSALNTLFRWTGDTLVLEVSEIEGELYFNEFLTENSTMYLDGILTETVTHNVKQDLNGILIPDRWSSQLFYFYGNDTIRLNTPNRVALEQDECKLMQSNSVFVGDDIGVVDNFKIGPIELTDQTAVSCVPMIISVDAYLVYDDNSFQLSHVVSLTDGMNVNGWKLLE